MRSIYDFHTIYNKSLQVESHHTLRMRIMHVSWWWPASLFETIKDFYLFWFCDEWSFCKPLCECPIHSWALYHFKNLFSPPTSYYLFSFINILSIVISFASFIFFLHIYYYYDPFCFLVRFWCAHQKHTQKFTTCHTCFIAFL